jgi:hypothetical protein
LILGKLPQLIPFHGSGFYFLPYPLATPRLRHLGDIFIVEIPRELASFLSFLELGDFQA